MNNKELTGSWKANTDTRISDNWFFKCADTLTLDADGRLFRQYDVTKIEEHADGSKEHFNVVITVVGYYTIDGDIITFKDMDPRYDNSRYFVTTDGCSDEVKKAWELTNAQKANSTLSEIMLELMHSKECECMHSHRGTLPKTQFKVKKDELTIIWKDYNAEYKMQKCEEPANLDRTTPPMPYEKVFCASADTILNSRASEPNIEHLKELAEQGDKAAIQDLESYYYKKKNYTALLELYSKIDIQGNARKYIEIGDLYNQQGDMRAAFKNWEKAANLGNAIGQRNIGICYYFADGVERNLKKAAEWLEKSAEQGDAVAQLNIAECYQKGEGVERDCTKAVMWYTKAAEQGEEDAYLQLGFCYENGEGVKQDYEVALDMYSKAGAENHKHRVQQIVWENAAEQGDTEIQCYLGLKCESENNQEKAIYWYEKAASQQHARAKFQLGLCYEKGKGKPQSLEKAIELYKSAAELGYVGSQVYLGNCYLVGKGVQHSKEQAVAWLEKAAIQGDIDAKFALKNLEITFIDAIEKVYFRITSNTTCTLEKSYVLTDYLILPEKVTIKGEEYTIIGIDSKCFNNCNWLKGIKLPETITTIGDDCFANCQSLKSVNLPDAITSLGNNCFTNCYQLTNIDLPKAITTLGNNCFANCKSLASIDLPDAITSLGNSCFTNCYQLTSIKLPKAITTLGDNCLANCWSLPNIDLPESVTALGNNCFDSCVSLTNINLPETTAVGIDCFRDCWALPSLGTESIGAQIDVRKITEIAAYGIEIAKRRFTDIEWKVGSTAYVSLFETYRQSLTICRAEVGGDDRLNKREVEQLLWLCTEFDGSFIETDIINLLDLDYNPEVFNEEDIPFTTYMHEIQFKTQGDDIETLLVGDVEIDEEKKGIVISIKGKELTGVKFK